RHRVSASASDCSKAFRHSCFASFGKIATVRGAGVSGILYIGESISSSKAQAGMATKNTKRHNKELRKAGRRGTSKRVALAESFMTNDFFFVAFCVFCGYSSSSFWPGELPRPHGQKYEQDHAGRADDPPVGRQQFIASEARRRGSLEGGGHGIAD